MGNGVHVVAQAPPEGVPINQNIGNNFHIPAQGGSQDDMDDHDDAFFMPKAESTYDAYGTSPVDIDRKFRMIEERFKAIEGPGTFGLDAVDMCLVLGVKISTKFKVPMFEQCRGTTCPKTHIISFYRKMAAYSDNEKLLMHFFQDSLSATS